MDAAKFSAVSAKSFLRALGLERAEKSVFFLGGKSKEPFFPGGSEYRRINWIVFGADEEKECF